MTLTWSGTDAVGEIDTYTILVSTDGGAFTPLLTKTKDVLDDIGRRYCTQKIQKPDFRSWNFDRWNTVRQLESSSSFMGLLEECRDLDSVGIEAVFK